MTLAQFYSALLALTLLAMVVTVVVFNGPWLLAESMYVLGFVFGSRS